MKYQNDCLQPDPLYPTVHNLCCKYRLTKFYTQFLYTFWIYTLKLLYLSLYLLAMLLAILLLLWLELLWLYLEDVDQVEDIAALLPG